MTSIRTATPEDYAAVAEIWQEQNAYHAALEPTLIRVVPEYQTEAEYRAILWDDNQTIFLAEENDRLLGQIWLVHRLLQGGATIEHPVVFVHELCVREKARRSGTGTMLLARAEEWARERNISRIEFNVWARNDAAIRFYESLGYDTARVEMFKELP